MNEEFNIRACSQCPGSYKLVPPGDPEYTEPKEKATSNDNIPRMYECNRDGHWNTIYWQKKEYFVVSKDFSSDTSLEGVRRSTKYSRGRSRGMGPNFD